MTPDLFWIPGPWKGHLAIVARPRGGDWLDDETAGWRRAGLDVLVSLLEEDESAELGLAREDEAAAASGIRFMSFPIPDRGTPGSTEQAVALLKEIVRLLGHGKNVAVHCRQGIGRSGLIAAGALMTAGLAPDKAIQVVGAARGELIPETDAQHQWIEQLASKHLIEAV